MIITEIVKMVLEVFNRIIDHIRIIHHWGNSNFLYELIPSVSFTGTPVIYVQEWIPTENKIRIRLLLQIWIKYGRVESLAVLDLYLVLGKTILTILQHACSAAG
jgi:hypothetical protein